MFSSTSFCSTRYLTNESRIYAIKLSLFKWSVKLYRKQCSCTVEQDTINPTENFITTMQLYLWFFFLLVSLEIKKKSDFKNEFLIIKSNNLIILFKFVNLFVWGFSFHSRIFHSYGEVPITGERLQILTYAQHSWPLSSEGSL